MAVLLIAEINDGALAMDATAKAVTAAKALGDVTVLACGASAKAAADEAATIDGVAKVLCAEDDLYGHRLAEPVAALIVYVRQRRPSRAEVAASTRSASTFMATTRPRAMPALAKTAWSRPWGRLSAA